MRHLLTHQCAITQTSPSTGRDSYGDQVYPETPTTGIACRYERSKKHFVIDSKGREVAVEGTLYLLPSQTIEPKDIITSITVSNAEVISSINLEVVAIDTMTDLSQPVYKKAYLKRKR
jgi:hypothetical protein